MSFTRNRPTATELLSDSQGLIRDNFNGSDDSFGVDHYKFSDTSSTNNVPNNGFHNTVTQPIINIVPPAVAPAHPTTTTNPIIYAMQDSSNAGVLQYSRGPVFKGYVPSPTPITELHSPSTPQVLNPSGTLDVLDFSGLSNVMGTLYIVNWPTSLASTGGFIGEAIVYWNSDTPKFLFIQSKTADTGNVNLIATSAGTILRVGNNGAVTANNVFWTLRFHRINK